MMESRSYKLLGVVGKGAFGTVYRARLESAGGFSKDVAIKILREDEPDEDLLSRFRDEARIIALVRDRAIVSVEPPVFLGGKWAVVMDFVDGHAANTLLRNLGVFPPGVALEIVAELSRVLYKAYHFKGPDGEPLQLLHRDLKPGNIQITSTGEVRLLDFGIARADFSGREAYTAIHIGGTPGYMAPERTQGVEEPAGDVYSLGVVLWRLLTNEAPGSGLQENLDERALELAGNDEHLFEALLLASRMRRIDPRQRPTHREVEARCHELRRNMPGPLLRDWAEQIPEKVMQEDELTGTVLTGTLYQSADLGLGPDPTTEVRNLVIGTGLVSFAFGGGAILVLALAVAGFGIGLFLATGEGEAETPVVAIPPEPPAVPIEPADATVPDAGEDPEAHDEGAEEGAEGEGAEEDAEGEQPDGEGAEGEQPDGEEPDGAGTGTEAEGAGGEPIATTGGVPDGAATATTGTGTATTGTASGTEGGTEGSEATDPEKPKIRWRNPFRRVNE